MSSLLSDDAPRLILGYVERYNNMRLKSAVGHVSLIDMLAEAAGDPQGAERKLAAVRQQRQIRRPQAA
jgi:hypothetical protein